MARRRYKRSSHGGGSTARADSRLSPYMCTRARARTYARSASRVCGRLFFFLLSVGRRSGRSPLWARYTSHDVTRRCRKRVRFNAVLFPPLLITRVLPLDRSSLLLLASRISPRSLHVSCLFFLSRSDPLLWQPLNWLFGGMHLSLIPEANPPTMDHESAFHAAWFHDGDDFQWCQRDYTAAIY